MNSVSPASHAHSAMTLHHQADTISPALVFIPDISGFTHFVRQTPTAASRLTPLP